jgi:hypothetical protein
MQDRANQAVADLPSRADVRHLTRALSAPFDPADVRFKPQVVSGNRALALAYVDARVIQDRLDAVLGVEGWQDDYQCLPDGSVVCRLRLRLGDAWVTKVDVGGPSEQPDGGDRLKAAFSDALKRAAVKFGIGRYLYRLGGQWVDYDPQRRQFVKTPQLPTSAVPKKEAASGRSSRPAAAKPAAKTGLHALPANGVELQRRLFEYDAKLAAQGLCRPGALVQHVTEAGAKTGHGTDLTVWSGPAFILAAEETRAFEAQARQRPAEHKDVA